MIDDKYREEVVRVADQAMAEFIRELPKMIKNKTSGAIAAMFGFENGSWDRWRVDHCNGRHSELSGWLSDKAKRLFREECEKVVTKKFIHDLVKKGKGAIQKDFEDYFMRELRSQVQCIAKSRAQEEAAEIMNIKMKSLKAEIDAIAQCAIAGEESETQMAILETEVNSG